MWCFKIELRCSSHTHHAITFTNSLSLWGLREYAYPGGFSTKVVLTIILVHLTTHMVHLTTDFCEVEDGFAVFLKGINGGL